MSGSDGVFRLTNIPTNPYHLSVTAAAFAPFAQDVSIRNAIPLQVKVAFMSAGGKTVVKRGIRRADVLETDPSAHVDIDRSLFLKIPAINVVA